MAKQYPPSEVVVPRPDNLEVYEVRGDRVVLDHDVAKIFGIETKRLNEQVTRNAEKVWR
jgi:hypothetical protein